MSSPHVPAVPRFLRLLAVVVCLLAAGAGAASDASAYSVECNDRTGRTCIAQYGYTGASTWGYPVDGAGNNCTNYAAFRLARNGAGNPGNLGNAGDWAGNARAKGFGVDGNPTVGSIAQWNYGSSYAPTYGHVAYVEAVEGATIYLSDSNWQGGSKRWRVTRGDRQYPNNFLHIRDVPQGNPFGSYDTAIGGTGEIRVAGWTIDASDRGPSTAVHIYVGGEAGVPGAEGHAFTANTSRPDVDAVHRAGPNHGFDVTFATGKRGAVPVCAYAINIGAGNNVGLGCKTVTVGDPNPFGSYDALTAPAVGGQVRVGGWAIDPNNRGAAIPVHVYVGGPAGTAGAEGNAITADLSRPDVDAVHRAGPNHGYDASLKTAKRGAQQVCVYAINIGHGDNVLLGCKTVTIGAPVVVPTPAQTPTSTPMPLTATIATPKPSPTPAPKSVTPQGGATAPPAASPTTCSIAKPTVAKGKKFSIRCSGPATSVTATFKPRRRGAKSRTIVIPLTAGQATAGTKKLPRGRYDLTVTAGATVAMTAAVKVR